MRRRAYSRHPPFISTGGFEFLQIELQKRMPPTGYMRLEVTFYRRCGSRAPSVFLSDLTKAPVACISERHMLRRNSLWYLSAESPPRTAPQAPHPRQHTWRLAEKAVCLCVSRNSLNRITKGRVTLLGSSSSECHVCEATWCLRCRTLSRTPPLEFKNTRRLLGN